MKGIKKFISSFSSADHQCVLEATRSYGTLLLYMLCGQIIAAILVNPKQIKYFARIMMAVTKTDDARLIALYGEKMHPPVYKMPAEAVILMKQKKVVLRQLKKQLTSLANLKGSFTVLPRTDKNSLKTLDKTIAFIQKQIVGLEADIVNIANEEFSKQIRSLTSVKGMGEKWVSDITYIRTGEGWLYLTAIMDLADRRIVGWSMDSSMTAASTIVSAWKMAIKNRHLQGELIFHSDRGIQYASHEFRQCLKGMQVLQSMSRKGNCWDNAIAESFFKTLKTELVYHTKFQTRAQAKIEIFDYIEVWYNRKRRHSALDYLTPVQVEQAMMKNKTEAA